MDLAFTRLLDSVKYESGTFIADFVSSFVIKGPLDGIYLRNNAGLCVGTLGKASCENLFSGIKDFASGFYWQVIQEHCTVFVND